MLKQTKRVRNDGAIARIAVACILLLWLPRCEADFYPYFTTKPLPGFDALDKDTSLVLYFDSSGSMSAMLPVLQGMIATGGPLYERLHEIYGGDYAKKVLVRSNASEDTLAMLALGDVASRPTKCVVFVFQDENDSEDTIPTSPGFLNDMKTLHDRIDSEFALYRGVVVQINDAGFQTSFETWFRSLENGTPPYQGDTGGLTKYTKCTPPRIKMLYGVPASDMAYFSNLVLDTLKAMGMFVRD
ncbi:MAG TPA: hypothetical protein VL354_18015 [Spirochaetia bacterium]|nr:hypothetical protein [Spirochaetia bacterium]